MLPELIERNNRIEEGLKMLRDQTNESKMDLNAAIRAKEQELAYKLGLKYERGSRDFLTQLSQHKKLKGSKIVKDCIKI